MTKIHYISSLDAGLACKGFLVGSIGCIDFVGRVSGPVGHIGSGQIFGLTRWVGSGWVKELVGWVGSGHKKVIHGQLWSVCVSSCFVCVLDKQS